MRTGVVTGAEILAAREKLIKGDAVNLPSHYARFKIEPIHFCAENKLDLFQSNIIKYVCRWDGKDGLQDLDKAMRYLRMYKKYIQGDPDWSAREADITAEVDRG